MIINGKKNNFVIGNRTDHLSLKYENWEETFKSVEEMENVREFKQTDKKSICLCGENFENGVTCQTFFLPNL